MDLDTPESRRTSWLVPYVAIAVAAVDIAALVVLVGFSSSIFPTQISDDLTSGVGSTGRRSAADAVAHVAALRERALVAFEANGVPRAAVALGAVKVERDTTYSASQIFTIHADDYPRFARFANRINRLQDADFGMSFPQAPFQRFLTGTLALLLIFALLSAVALETRKADVSRSPKGMHPMMIGVQTLMYGVIAVTALVYLRFLGDGIVGPFLIFEAIFSITLAVWLYQTRRSWTQSTSYRIAYVGYIVALVLVSGFAIWTSAQPMI